MMKDSIEQSGASEEVRYNEKLFRLVSHTLVMLMMSCAAYTLSTLIHHFFADWSPGVIAALAFFIAFERLFTYPRFRRLTSFSRQWFVDLAAQWIIMLLVIRTTLGLAHGLDAFRNELLLMAGNFWAYFLSPEYLIALGILLPIWFLTGFAAELLEAMGLDQTRIRREVVSLDSRYVPPRARLLSFIFTLGTVLIFFTGLVRMNIRDIFEVTTGRVSIELNALSSGGASTLLYFMFGLALLSQTQFISLHTNWRLQGIRVSRGLASHWGPYSLIFLAILAAIVSLLPTHFGLGMLSTLGYVIDVLVRILFFIAQLILSILLLLISIPFRLFGSDGPQMEFPPPPELPELPVGEAIPEAGFPIWALIRSIFSWLLLLGILGFALRHFLRQHGELLDALNKFPAGRWLARLWIRVRSLFVGAGSRMAALVEAGVTRLRAFTSRQRLTSPVGFLSLRRLDPRQRVYYFYLALVRRGAESGLQRSGSQTPYEYAATLESALPAVDTDIEALTGSFVEARYSRHPVPAEKANVVKTTWERIRRALRGIKEV
jgi:hypothetical protein